MFEQPVDGAPAWVYQAQNVIVYTSSQRQREKGRKGRKRGTRLSVLSGRVEYLV